MSTDEIKNEIDEFRKWEEKIERKDLKYKTNKFLYNFQQFETIRSFGDGMKLRRIKPICLENIVKFNNKSKPKTNEGQDRKRNTFYGVNALYDVQELTINDFISGMF